MDDKSQKERLDQELMFLKESFDAEVISQEEYEKGKARVERKLKELQDSENERSRQERDESTKDEPVKAEESAKEPEINDEASDESIESREGESIKLKVIQEEPHEEHEAEAEPQKAEGAETRTVETQKEEIPKLKTELEPKNKKKFIKYTAVFVVLLLVAFFSYSLLKNTKGNQGTVNEAKFIDAKTNVIILNDRKECFNCDTARILSILESWFGALNVKEIDYSTNEGKILADKINAKMLPAYILEDNIAKWPKFEQVKQAFIKNDNSYILSDDAAAPTFYFRRESIPSSIELFVTSDTASLKAEKNLKEFLDAFKNVKFEKHFAGNKTTQELGIKSFPTFLISNRVKFSGVHAAETIKDNFCRMNKLPECEKSLSRNLIT